jgi:Integrase core domain
MRGCSHRPNTSSDYATLAGDLEVRLSTGRTGQCWDNALAGSFFASLKGECLDHQLWPTRAAARRATVDYIAWYNGARLHSALGYQTPDQYESITPRRSLLRQPDRAIGPVRQTGQPHALGNNLPWRVCGRWVGAPGPTTIPMARPAPGATARI